MDFLSVKGDSSTCTATPDAGYQVQAWGGDCAGAGTSIQCYLPEIQKDQEATVSFAPQPANTYTVTASVNGGNGSVSCAPGSVTAGGSSTCTAVPDAGYQVDHWEGACLLAAQAAQCDLSNIQTDQASTVAFSSAPVSTYSIGGTVSGLASGGSLVLQNNGADDLTLNANGGFVFSNRVVQGGSYRVTVRTQPSGQTCTVANGNGSNVAADVTNVAVTCADVPRDATLIMRKVAEGGDGTFPFTSAQLGAFNLTTSDGEASRTFANLAAGSYQVEEGETTGWSQVAARCDNGDNPDSIDLGAGETVTCVFGNRLSAAGIPTMSTYALALLGTVLMVLGGWQQRRGRVGR